MRCFLEFLESLTDTPPTHCAPRTTDKGYEQSNAMTSIGKMTAVYVSFIHRGLPCILITVITCIAVTGCALYRVKRVVKESRESTVIVGHVAGPAPVQGPIVVAAYLARGGRKEVTHHTILHDVGEFELMVPLGDYYIFAYNDRNSNLVYDDGEPAGQYGPPKTVVAPAGGVVKNIEIEIPEKGRPIDWPVGVEIIPIRPTKLYSRMAGEITDLEDPRFEEEHGSRGFWDGLSFYKEFGASIFFLEPYDPQKTPILFIHGAGGTPKGWKFFAENIDRTRFQPWFFYYPTGSRIRSMSHQLLWKLMNLQMKYKFDNIILTAHSMGGLVARSFIVDHQYEFPYVKLFISLATPWGGDKMAEYGVRQSPGVIPCWRDMQPEGSFIQGLYRTKLPNTVDFYMFFGHRGNRNPFRSNNDNTITMASLLDRRAQVEAKMNYAFDEDHTSIIYSREVLDQFNAVLDSWDGDKHTSGTTSGGYIKVNFSYDYPENGPRPWPKLRLVYKGKKPTDIEISLTPEDSGKKLGPFASGKYWARIYATNVRPQKQWVPVGIQSGRTEGLDFVFTPDGTISGYITSAMKAEDRTAGMPAWEFRSEHNRIGLESVTLEGPGIYRNLDPIEDENFFSSWHKRETARKDYCHNGYLRFYGLPAGTYELVIKAKGHKLLLEKHAVTPGRESAFRFYILSPTQEEPATP